MRPLELAGAQRARAAAPRTVHGPVATPPWSVSQSLAPPHWLPNQPEADLDLHLNAHRFAALSAWAEPPLFDSFNRLLVKPMSEGLAHLKIVSSPILPDLKREHHETLDPEPLGLGGVVRLD